MNPITYKHYEKILKESDPLKRAPYNKNRSYKEGKRGGLTSK